MPGALQRCALKHQQQHLRHYQPLARHAVRPVHLHNGRARLRQLRALGGPDEHHQETGSKAESQQELPAAAGSEQQQISTIQQPDEQSSPAQDPQAEAAVAAALALGDEQAAEEEVLLHEPHREVDHAANKAAARVYRAMAAGLTAAGLAVAVCARPVAASCLKLGGMPLVQAAALVGCAGAGMMRAASLALFLAEGAAAGELSTWRYQRINLALMACCALAALVQPFSWAAAQPWLLAAALAAAAAGAVTCGSIFLQQWRRNGVIFASAVGYGDWIEALQATWVYLVRDLSSLAGALLAVLTVVATLGGMESLTGPAVSVDVPWLTGAAAAAHAASLQYMRKLLGVGLLLTAVQCWALSEFAAQARKVTTETAIKLIMVGQQELREYLSGQLPAPVHVPPARFDLLHLGFFAAAVVQGLWLWTAASAGGPAAAGLLNMNSGDPLWASLYWSLLCSAFYLATVVGRINFGVLWSWVVGFASYLSGWVSFFTVILYADWEWLREVRRK